MHELRAEHRGGASFEQEILSVDPEEITCVLVVQPPDVKPLKGSVKLCAHANMLPCRVMESVLIAKKVRGYAPTAKPGGGLIQHTC